MSQKASVSIRNLWPYLIPPKYSANTNASNNGIGASAPIPMLSSILQAVFLKFYYASDNDVRSFIW